MICSRCKNPEADPYLDTWLCDACFSKMIEKRVQKDFRQHIARNLDLKCIGPLTGYLVAKFIFDRSINITYLPDMTLDEAIKNRGVIVFPWTADHESLYYLNCVVSGTVEMPYLGVISNVIKLFLSITEEEAIRYARIKKLSYTPIPESIGKSMVDELTEQYPQINHQFGKSVREIAKVLKG